MGDRHIEDVVRDVAGRAAERTFADIIGSGSIRVSPPADGEHRVTSDPPPSFAEVRTMIEEARAAQAEMDERLHALIDEVMSAVDECIEAGHGAVMVDQRDLSVHVFPWADLDGDGRPYVYVFDPPATFPPLGGDDR